MTQHTAKRPSGVSFQIHLNTQYRPGNRFSCVYLSDGIQEEPMNYIHITKKNLDKGISAARCPASQAWRKREWLRQRFDEDLFFTAARSAASALSNIFPQKTHGCPLKQRDISYINCLWIAGAMKGTRIFDRPFERVHPGCQSAGKEPVVCITVRRGTQAGISHADPKYLAYKGFRTAISPTAGSA